MNAAAERERDEATATSSRFATRPAGAPRGTVAASLRGGAWYDVMPISTLRHRAEIMTDPWVEGRMFLNTDLYIDDVDGST